MSAGANNPATDGAQVIRRVYFGLMVVLGLGSIDQSIVSTALPRIVADLGGLSHLSWVVTAYVLASTATMPLYGRLSDQYGRRPLILIAILLFLAGSMLCGLARTLPELIVFRALQGLGAGGFMPLSQIIIGDLVPPAARGKRQGGIAAVYAACSVVGPLLGGVVTDVFSWHWIFYINLPFGLWGVWLIARALPHSTPGGGQRIDFLGSFLLTSATTAVLLLLTLGGVQWPWTAVPTMALALLAAGLTAALLWHVRRVPDPVLPLDLFSNRVFDVACVVMALSFMGLLGASVFFPLFFQVVRGVSPARSGLLTAPLMIGVVLSSVFNGRVLLRSGRYKPAQLIGLFVATLALAVVTWGIRGGATLAVIEPPIFLLGLGLGLVVPNMTIAVQNALPPERRGVGTSMLAFFRSLGGLLGVTGSGALFARHVQNLAGAAVRGPEMAGGLDVSRLAGPARLASMLLYRQAISQAFALGVAMIALAWCCLWLLPELPLHGRQERG